MEESKFISSPIVLTGNSLIFTDLHLGLANSASSRLKIATNVMKEIIKACIDHDVKQVFFLGDAFHNRKSLELSVMNIGLKLFNALAKKTDVYMVVGNHDLYYKNLEHVSSTNMFHSNPRIHVISTCEQLMLNSQTVLLVPWLGKAVGMYKENSFDILMGHFDISSRYLITSYIEDQLEKQRTRPVSSLIRDVLENDELLNEANEAGGSGFIDKDEALADNLNSEVDEIIRGTVQNAMKSAEMIGAFVKIAKKKTGVIYAGHIHKHKEFNVSDGRKFIFVGSPYQQTFGEMDSKTGYYILDSENKHQFFETTSAPKFVKLRYSDIVNAGGPGSYDFSELKNSIVKKIIDIEVNPETESRINKAINSAAPFEEQLPDWDVNAASVLSADGEIVNENLDMINSSKLGYINNYVNSLDPDILKEKGVDKDKLLNLMEHYYAQVDDASASMASVKAPSD